MVISIDGPAGAGKSSTARALAAALDFAYLDSGAMYRSVALASLRRGGSEGSPKGALGELAREVSIELLPSTRDGPAGGRVLLDGEDVTEAIRTPEVSDEASRIAAIPDVRTALVERQRELIASGDWVVEGRDIGTVVAPDASLKVFLTAQPDERARRRARELGADAASVLVEQTLRDERDRARAHSPLRPAAGAVTLDTTGLSPDAVLTRLCQLARERGAG